MKRILSISVLIACFFSCTAQADNSGSSASSSAGPDKAALEAALTACASSVSKDSSGRPDMKAMEACMTAKGFSRPSGAPPGQGGGGTPPNK
jgi:hypothetical protein